MILRHITIYYHNIIKPLKTILRSYMDVGIPGILSLIAWCAGASATDAAHVAAEVLRATRAANAGDAGDAAVKDRKDSGSQCVPQILMLGAIPKPMTEGIRLTTPTTTV